MSHRVPEQRAYPVELEKTKNNRLTIRLATYGREYDLGAFVEELRAGVFRKSLSESARALPLHVNHNHAMIPVGKATDWQDGNDVLLGTFDFDTRAEAQEMARLVDEGYMTGASIGFAPISDEWTRTGAKPKVVRREARMLETSLVSVPAYEDAGVLALRSMGHPEIPDLTIVPKPRLLEAQAILASIRTPN